MISPMKAQRWAMPQLARVALFVFCGFVGCVRPYDPVVIRFSGEDVRLSAFENELETLKKTGVDTTAPGFRVSAFDRFLEDQVLAMEARRLGLGGSRDRAAIEGFLLSRVGPIEVTDEEGRRYFNAHPELANAQSTVTLREILVLTQQDARDVVRILGSDPNSFELLARTRSRSPQAGAGGLIGTFRRGELPPEIDRAVFSLSKGAISPIIATSFGFHIFRIEATTPSGPRLFEEVREAVDAQVTEAKTRAAVRQLLTSILSRTQVNRDAVERPHNASENAVRVNGVGASE